MLKTEAQLEAEIAALLRKAELIDAQEDARYGKGKRGDELPKELQLRQDRLDALRKARAELEAEAQAAEAAAAVALDAHLSTSRQSHGKRPRPSRGQAPRDLDARGRMERKLRSKAGQAIYALRKTIAEPVFGQIKGARGLDRFLLRGLDKVNGEWSLMAITRNIGKLHRAALAAS